MIPRYMVTVEELTASFNVVPPPTYLYPDLPRRQIPRLPKPFTSDRQPLEGTSYTCQIGISFSTRNPNFVEWRQRCVIQDSGDERSGVVIFDGDTVIGGYTAKGNQPRPPWFIGIHPDYQNQSLATTAIREWFKAAPLIHLVTWPASETAVQAFVTAHKQYVEWEIEKGTTVPQRVIDSVRA